MFGTGLRLSCPIMSVTDGAGLTDRPSDEPSPYRGSRIKLKRWIWSKLITSMAPFVVRVERRLPGRDAGIRVANAGARLMVRLVGARIAIRGTANLPVQGAILTPNHRSAFDIAAIMAAIPGARFAAKKELFDDPVIGEPMRALGMVPIDRDNPSEAKRALEQARVSTSRPTYLVMFPEGVVAPRSQMQPFKSGAFVLAIQTGLPIVPVAIHNAAGVMPDDGGRVTILGGWIRVDILPAIQTSALSLDDRHALKERTRSALLDCLRPIDGGRATSGASKPSASR